jgi:hypothetical protein
MVKITYSAPRLRLLAVAAETGVAPCWSGSAAGKDCRQGGAFQYPRCLPGAMPYDT